MVFEQLTGVLPGRPNTEGFLLLGSCSSNWVFDTAAHRLRRLPRDASLSVAVPAPWADYHRLEIDDSGAFFTVEFDPLGRRLLRAWLHEDPCPRCQGQASGRRPQAETRIGEK